MSEASLASLRRPKLVHS